MSSACEEQPLFCFSFDRFCFGFDKLSAEKVSFLCCVALGSDMKARTGLESASG